jgi:hypothetical protein
VASSERQLVVKIVGDTKGISSAVSEAEGSLNRLKAGAVAVGGALTAAFAASKVVDFIGESVRAAIEEEKAMALLAQTMRDTTGARQADIDSMEAWITTTQNATGIIDDKLRPAMQILLNATHDSTEAQTLLQTAMDISTSRGLDLSAVALALGKAHDGNVASLGRLGIAYKDTEGNVLSFTQIVKNANTVFGGATQEAADTTAGKLDKLNGRWQDMKEKIGTQLLPVLNIFVGYIAQTFIPNIERIWNAFTSGDGVVNRVIDILNSIKWAFQHAINAIIDILNVGIAAYNKIPLAPNIGKIGTSNIHEGDIGHINVGGGSSGGGLANLVDSVKGAFAAGAIANVDNTTGTSKGGGGGGGGGGKSAAELKKEADDKLIGEALQAWAKARDDQRQIEDDMYENDQLSFVQYKDILTKRLAVAVKGSDEWTQVQIKLNDVTKKYQDQQVKDAQKNADDLKKISDQRLKDMQDALNKTMEIEDNEYKVGALSADAYLSILRGRLAGLEQFSNEWTQTFQEIQQVSADAGYGPVSASSLGATANRVGDSIVGGSGSGIMISGPVTVVANDPRQLVQQLQAIDRTYGGVPINVRTPA